MECLRPTEPEDEVYCHLEGAYLDGSGTIRHRLPSTRYWTFVAGQRKSLNVTLFHGPVEAGLWIRLCFIEQEAHGLISSLRMLNENLGELLLRCFGSGEFSLEPYHAATPYGRASAQAYAFDLKGSAAHYRLWLRLTAS
jgi:hypothetical protein